jgi:hypothetical protein
MTEWASYDVDGKRVPPSSKRAAFRAKEVSVSTQLFRISAGRSDAVARVAPNRRCRPLNAKAGSSAQALPIGRKIIALLRRVRHSWAINSSREPHLLRLRRNHPVSPQFLGLIERSVDPPEKGFRILTHNALGHAKTRSHGAG